MAPYAGVRVSISTDSGKLTQRGGWERQAERLAEDLKAVVDDFEPDRFMLAGHGLGGAVVTSFLERFGYEYNGCLAGIAIIESDKPAGPEAGLIAKLLAHRHRYQPDIQLYQSLVDKLGNSSLYYVCFRCNIRRVVLESPIDDLSSLLFGAPYGE